MKVDKIIGDIGHTLDNYLKDELSLIKGFLKAIDKIKQDKDIKEIEEKKLIALMIKEVMIEAQGSINPNYVEKKAQEYLSKF